MKISERTPDDILELIKNFTLFDDDYMSAVFEVSPKCAYDSDDKFGELMHDFRTSNLDEMHDSVLKEKAKYLKREVKGVETICKAVKEIPKLLNLPVDKVLN